MHEQISLWECMYETKKITKPIRLIECFAGIGSQFKALKKVFGDKVESYKIVEWAYNSIVAYNNIHLKDKTDYSKDLTKEEIISKIKGISTNYNEPLSEEQLNKKPLVWLQKAYNNIKATHNLIDIMKVKGDDLRIRKLTPKETTRLMGFEDSDYDAMKQDLSDMAIYHCCGDSIVVNVLENIFKQMKQEQ